MSTRPPSNLFGSLLFALLVLGGCDSIERVPESPSLDSESHWLLPCTTDLDCGSLTCICSVCTVACSDTSTCQAQTVVAACRTTDTIGCQGLAAPPLSACAATCEEDTDCLALGEAFTCQQGQCLEARQACETSATCPLGHYCKKPGDCEAQGLCTRPGALTCPDTEALACGCNGHTFLNTCHAALAGVSVSELAPCEEAPCTNSSECEEGLFCHFSTSCGSTEPGQCLDRPSSCPESDGERCGCDGELYADQCHASLDGVSLGGNDCR